MKIIVSHAKKQHVYRLVYALQNDKKLKKFYTALFFKKSGFLRKIFSFSQRTNELIQKRAFPNIKDENVFLTILPELFSNFARKFSIQHVDYYTERVHDNIVSFLLNFTHCDIFIGYEVQSLKSFKKVKQKGGITILDLASIHVLKQIEINEKYDYILNAFQAPNQKHVEKMKKTKLEELQYTDYIITLSEFAKQSCIEYGFPENKIKMMSLGIDTSLFSLKQSYSFEKFEILFVAGVRYWKGIKDLIEVFHGLNLDNATLTIVGGEGDALSYVKENLSPNIKYIPHVNHNELKILYQNSSIFVLPTYMDSFGQVIFEAMSCGTPVITTTHSGAPGIIIDNHNGFIISPHDQKALKEKILYFYENKTEVERMGKNARKSVETLTWEKYYNKINTFIDDITEKHSL